MTAPYTQQNYADWKARFQQTSAVGGLLRQAKQAAGMEEEPQTLLAPTPPFNPNVEQPRLGRVNGIHQWTQAEMEQAPQTPADLHEHQRGILGGLRHLVGADRTAPEVAALLTPDQQKRARPGLLSTVYNAVVEGKGPQTVQQERALNMLALGDAKKGRDMTAQQEATARRIEAVAATMSPQDGAEYAARMKGIYGLPTAQAAISAAVGLKEREFAPQRVTWTTVPMMVNGKQAMVMRSNDGQLLDAASGTDLRETGARMEPMPQQAPPNQILPSINPDGTPGYTAVSGRGGEVKVTPVEDVKRPDASGRTTAAVRAQVASNRTQIRVIDETLAELARHPDATGLHRALGDDVNQRMDPAGVLARAGIANVGSLKIHDRTGAVMAAREQPRLVPFIPGIRDLYEANVTKLKALRRWIEDETAELERGAPASGTKKPMPARIAELKAEGKSKEEALAILRREGYQP